MTEEYYNQIKIDLDKKGKKKGWKEKKGETIWLELDFIVHEKEEDNIDLL